VAGEGRVAVEVLGISLQVGTERSRTREVEPFHDSPCPDEHGGGAAPISGHRVLNDNVAFVINVSGNTGGVTLAPMGLSRGGACAVSCCIIW
jgi:hypothetical protein